MAGSADFGRGSRRAPIAAINITPLVDVMLVLLVIMMVSATHIVSQTIKVNLPKTATSDGATPSIAAVTVDAEHRIYLNKVNIELSELGARLRRDFPKLADITLVVSADAKTDHGEVMRVVDAARVEGVTNFAINVEKTGEKTR